MSRLDGLTRFGIWDALGRPGHGYTQWCTAHWRAFEIAALGYRIDDGAERYDFMVRCTRDFDAWLEKTYEKSVKRTADPQPTGGR